MLCSLPLAIIGYAVIANTNNNQVKYGMTFLMATGLYSSVPPVLGWLSNVSFTPRFSHSVRSNATASINVHAHSCSHADNGWC